MMRSKYVGRIVLLMMIALIWAKGSFSQICNRGQSSNARVFAPEKQRALMIKDTELAATIQPLHSPFEMTLASVNAAKTGLTIHMPEELAQVDEICLRKDRIIVRGMINNALEEIVIFDKSTGELIDKFRAYWPNICLQSGMVIFTKEYPIHFASGTEDHYLIYKLDSPPEANHAPGAAPVRSRPAGIPLFPPTVGNQIFDNTNLHGNMHEQTAAGFFWDGEGQQAVTLDSFEDRYSLILIQFSANDAIVKSWNADAHSICETKQNLTCPAMLYLLRAVFVSGQNGDQSVIASFGRPQDPVLFEITVPLSAFSVIGKRSLTNPQWIP